MRGLRHYHGLDRFEGRLTRLLSVGGYGRMQDVMAQVQPEVSTGAAALGEPGAAREVPALS